MKKNKRTRGSWPNSACFSAKRNCMWLMAIRCSTSYRRNIFVLRSRPSCGDFQRNITADNHVMIDEQRENVCRIWKDAYHRDPPPQQELQKRDSCGTFQQSNCKGKCNATQRAGTIKSRANQLAVKSKTVATGGNIKTEKDAPLLLS